MSIKDLQAEQQPLEVQQIQARFIQLEKELVTQTPGLPEALAEIHKQLQQHEELIHILSDEDLALLHKSFEGYKQIVVFQSAVKKIGKTKKVTDAQLNNI